MEANPTEPGVFDFNTLQPGTHIWSFDTGKYIHSLTPDTFWDGVRNSFDVTEPSAGKTPVTE